MQGLRLGTFPALGPCLIHGQGTKILPQKKKKNNSTDLYPDHSGDLNPTCVPLS